MAALLVLALIAVAMLPNSVKAARPLPQCAAQMDAFCNSPALASCKAEIAVGNGTLPLVAVHDAGAGGGSAQWRCYSPTCLDAGGTRSLPGCSLYCTHDSELATELDECATTSLFVSGQNKTACFRIPSVISVGDDTLLAFTEARRLSCSDKGPKSLAASEHFPHTRARVDQDRSISAPQPMPRRNANTWWRALMPPPYMLLLLRADAAVRGWWRDVDPDALPRE